MEKSCLSWLQKSWQPSDYDRPRKKEMWVACGRDGSDLEGVVKARVLIQINQVFYLISTLRYHIGRC